MAQRIDYSEVAPEATKGILNIEKYVGDSNLEPSLIELVKLRASQINGCAYCIDMHTKDARNNGETEQRLYALNAWRETDFYSERERTALKWTEVLTEISKNGVPDKLYYSVRRYFDEEELVTLTMAVVAINGWNRLAISFGNEPGSYKPELAK